MLPSNQTRPFDLYDDMANIEVDNDSLGGGIPDTTMSQVYALAHGTIMPDGQPVIHPDRGMEDEIMLDYGASPISPC